MTVLANAFYIARPYLVRQIRSRTLWLFLLMGIMSPFLIRWNGTTSALIVAGMDLDSTFEEGRSWALQYSFYDLYMCSWLLIVFFVFNRVLLPLTSSYTVSHSLWLRLSQANNFSLALSRVFQVLFAAICVVVASIVWATLFSLLHGLNFAQLMPPVYGLVAYVLLSGGLIVMMPGKPTTRMTKRTAYVILAFSIPMLLYIVGKDSDVVQRTSGFFPFAVPLGIKDLGQASLNAYKSASILGAVLMGLSLARCLLLPLNKKLIL